MVSDFIEELEQGILSEIDFTQNRDQINQDIENYITDNVDSACIYTDDCWDIAKDIYGSSSFPQGMENIIDLAYSGLIEEVYNNIDIDLLIDDKLALMEEEEEDEL